MAAHAFWACFCSNWQPSEIGPTVENDIAAISLSSSFLHWSIQGLEPSLELCMDFFYNRMRSLWNTFICEFRNISTPLWVNKLKLHAVSYNERNFSMLLWSLVYCCALLYMPHLSSWGVFAYSKSFTRWLPYTLYPKTPFWRSRIIIHYIF